MTVVGVVGGGSRWIVGAGACGEEALDGKEWHDGWLGFACRAGIRRWQS